MLCAKILLHDDRISQAEWNYLVSTATQSDRSVPPQPEATLSWLSARQWKGVCELSDEIPHVFKDLPDDVARGQTIVLNISNPREASSTGLTIQLYEPLGVSKPAGAGTNWDDKLSLFQKTILIRVLREEEFVAAVTEFVRIQLGREFVEAPAVDLHLLHADMDRVTPLVFVLSTGSDPMAQLQRFARQMDYGDRIHSMSLGQGQGPAAEKLLAKAAENGDWVFLQVYCNSWFTWFEAVKFSVN